MKNSISCMKMRTFTFLLVLFLSFGTLGSVSAAPMFGKKVVENTSTCWAGYKTVFTTKYIFWIEFKSSELVPC